MNIRKTPNLLIIRPHFFCCYSLSIEYYDSVKEWLFKDFHAINGYHSALGIYYHILK